MTGRSSLQKIRLVARGLSHIRRSTDRRVRSERVHVVSIVQVVAQYVVVYELDGKVLAHGSNPKFVGKDMSDAEDVDGKLFVKERVEMAAKQASFWQDYKFVNPVSKKVEPKQMYCERLDNTAVCAGIYKS